MGIWSGVVGSDKLEWLPGDENDKEPTESSVIYPEKDITENVSQKNRKDDNMSNIKLPSLRELIEGTAKLPDKKNQDLVESTKRETLFDNPESSKLVRESEMEDRLRKEFEASGIPTLKQIAAEAEAKQKLWQKWESSESQDEDDEETRIDKIAEKYVRR